MKRPRTGFLVWVPLATLLVGGTQACGSDANTSRSRDAGAESDGDGGGKAGASAGGSAATDAGPSVAPRDAVCGGVTCHPGTSSVESSACCTDSDDCGLRLVISPSCLTRNEKGGVDSRCAPFEIPGMLTLPGCCSPTGCGALANFDSLGCLPNPSLGRATVPCTPDVPFE
jgi:hypothetical protein